MRKLKITIAGTDRTRLVVPESLLITNILSQKADEAEFVIRKFGDRTFSPEVNQEVIITTESTGAFPFTFPFTFAEGTTKIFAGYIIQVDENYDKLDYVEYKIKCIDYTQKLNQKLVVDSFENQTVAQIISSIKQNYMPNDVTLNNVVVTTNIRFISFNYEYPSECLKQLAELTDSDWYIDYDKDIHFFPKQYNSAPFDLSDTGGKYIYDSLRIRRDLTRLRNVIYVRGGEFLGTTVTAEFLGNGTQRTFFLPYKMADLQATVSGQIKNIGVDPLDEETLYDGLHNFQEKFVRFREDKKPGNGKAVNISGRPYLPVLVKVKDDTSMQTFTATEHVIIDKSIKSKEGARQRAAAELISFKSTLSEGAFRTYESGLRSGQVVNIQSTLRGLDEDFVINKVRLRWFGIDGSTGDDMLEYEVNLVTKQTYDHIDLLLSLLNKTKKEIVINEDEILDEVEAVEETITITDSASASISHNATPETITIGESVTVQALNYGVQFVLGPLSAPSGTKRLFILNGSPLA